ncbi:DegT/DnrJ/EryC1/StrS family aminotransferase [Mangrovicoccus algicola]|uniref:Aminotransferase class I/II-fold pyridoxal phosphate-dependent enzyme n=1 Tax=Mangrovicoccus algicola TaxID=2771008 RepID=A0A8J7CVY8_9RHOB|nr:aminotransferase class I/II-fold pyridoxal phosphate-dependent enzyme [Mangrovicoccus algicola]MBE3639314.1 aminotransferase class I/II-fold pyridoxal phosphate-dependent enzyme [Mangrovicoccus algicola]
MTTRFTGNFTQQEPIPEEAIQAAVAVMRSGRLHRYNLGPQEEGEVSALEREFAAWSGARYCLAVASGGYAIATALRALGVGPGDRVLTNAFTLAPVPGAIASLGAVPVLVEVTPDLVIDLEDLAARADQAKVLLLSHMRGHLCDMDRLMEICDAAGIRVIEDCAHTMGARWRGVLSGRHGAMACYSTQTYKHMNSGEGGLLISDDPDLMARAVLMSGSYMLYPRHGAAPAPEVFERHRLDMPNISGRMDHLRAAILRPQLAGLEARCAAWTERYRAVESCLRDVPGVKLPPRPQAEAFVGSSIQFLLPGRDAAAMRAYVAACAARGVELKWFGADSPAGFTSRYDHWRYAAPAPLPATDAVLAGLLDMRLPLTFSLEDCRVIGTILAEEARAAAG